MKPDLADRKLKKEFSEMRGKLCGHMQYTERIYTISYNGLLFIAFWAGL